MFKASQSSKEAPIIFNTENRISLMNSDIQTIAVTVLEIQLLKDGAEIRTWR